MRKPDYEANGVRLYCGDCREVLPDLEPGSVRLVWSDPPYGNSNMANDLQAARIRDDVKGARKQAAEPIQNDSQTEMVEVVDESLSRLVPLLAPDCCCCCGGGGHNGVAEREPLRVHSVGQPGEHWRVG